MSKEYLPHIFEEFSREHTSTESKVIGTGLGLPIVKALIDLMGGTIEIESEVGKGTKTTVMIPFEIATQEQILEEQQKEKEFVPEDIKGKRIMTANAFEEDRQKALDAGMNAHVSKPVDMNVLFRVMAKFI